MNMKRIILKLSGEVFGSSGFNHEDALYFVDELKKARKSSQTQIAIVLGGGNIWRGRDSKEFDFHQAESDAIGIGATVLNAAVAKRMLEQNDIPAEVFSAHQYPFLSKLHSIADEDAALESGAIALLAGGTGAPFFTTDSAAVLRALELQADAVFKATKVDGVYSADPKTNPNAERFDRLTFDQAIEKDLQVMDATAFTMAEDRNLPIFVFDFFQKDALKNALEGNQTGTWIR
jgi:uridylate kinase